jgi:type II secretory pathway component GspD/PulD (secretin)
MRDRLVSLALCAVLSMSAMPGIAQPAAANRDGRISLIFRDVPVTELFEMLSRKERVSIILARGVTGNVTVNLYDTTVREAIHTIAEAAGFLVEERGGTYLIFNKENRQASIAPAGLGVRTVTVQYSDPELVASIVSRHGSPGGRVTLLKERKALVIEDTADNLDRMERLVREIDRQPEQITIEAQILEITLDSQQQFGVDWRHVFGSNNQHSILTQGLAANSSTGLFLNIVNANVQLYLNALSEKGRVNTLATPKLLTLENQEAVTKIGDQIGYRVTTTNDGVTSETIDFLDTGVILRVTPSVDADGRIAMKIRPEVSSGSVSGSIPSKKTTEVTTQLVAEDGQSILIGGLIKNSEGRRRTGVPVLGDIPGVGALFSRTETIGVSTETIVIITPRIVRSFASVDMAPTIGKPAAAAGKAEKHGPPPLQLDRVLSSDRLPQTASLW